jgi:NAD(P)-dependent dehydrogenase (short-subunit alcohol dehydrogenase family)
VTRAIAGSSVVITGASSGIGLAAALRFAAEEARLTLAGRDGEAVAAATARCEELGAAVVGVGADVGVPGEAERVAAAAEERFGRIDTWVNCAAVMAYGEFDEIPAEVFRKVIETNLLGQVEGARAALTRFRGQGGGVLINMSSVWGRVTTPLVSPYSVSKHAVRAFSECLRHELVDEPQIAVATMVPQAVDTPIFDHAATYIGKPVRPIPPILKADEIADGIVACARSPKPEVSWGRSGRALEVLYALWPRAYCRIAPAIFMRGSFADATEARSDGNVLVGRGGGRTSGGWRARRRQTLVRALFAAVHGGLLGLVGRSARAKP